MIDQSLYTLDVRHAPPVDAPPSWFHDVLSEIRRTRLGSVDIRLENHHGKVAPGRHECASDEPLEAHGAIVLEKLGRLTSYNCCDVAAFTLIGEGPIDHSDELHSG